MPVADTCERGGGSLEKTGSDAGARRGLAWFTGETSPPGPLPPRRGGGITRRSRRSSPSPLSSPSPARERGLVREVLLTLASTTISLFFQPSEWRGSKFQWASRIWKEGFQILVVRLPNSGTKTNFSRKSFREGADPPSRKISSLASTEAAVGLKSRRPALGPVVGPGYRGWPGCADP